MNKNVRIAIAFGVIVLVMVWLTISGFDNNMQYYVGVKELLAKGNEAVSQNHRVRGMLVPGSLVQSQSSLQCSFKIEEEGEELEVRFAKELPDTFKDGAEVLVEGSYHADGYFDAQQLMAKCPSKYESTDVYNSEEYKARYGPSEGTN